MSAGCFWRMICGRTGVEELAKSLRCPGKVTLIIKN